ncbi:MAG: 50S ribosomal protein L23 [bacterium]|nr:50S ribosomal protein L23 [bacterium]
MAWFWQKQKQETEQRSAQQDAAKAKRNLLKPAAGKKEKDSAAAAAKSDLAPKGKKVSASTPAKNARAFGILLGPVVTEKAARLAEEGTFVFEVTPRANKIQIARAVSSLYNVNPVRVTVVNGHRKPKVFAQRAGVRSGIRKAYVTLQKGQHIEFFETETTK